MVDIFVVNQDKVTISHREQSMNSNSSELSCKTGEVTASTLRAISANTDATNFWNLFEWFFKVVFVFNRQLWWQCDFW